MLATSLREESLAPSARGRAGSPKGSSSRSRPTGSACTSRGARRSCSAASLARIAKAGEVLVDGDVRALRAGQLALLGARSATDAGQRVRGWRLDLERPWKHGPPVIEASPPPPIAAPSPPPPSEVVSPPPPRVAMTQPLPRAEAREPLPSVIVTPNPVDAAPTAERDEVIVVTAEELEVVRPDPDATLDETEDALQLLSELTDPDATHYERDETEDATQMLSVADATLDARDETEDATQMLSADDFEEDELSTADVLQVIEAADLQPFEDEGPSMSARRREGTLANRVRALSQHDKNRDPVVAIADLRRARQRAEGAAPAVRCQAVLALAMTLSLAGREEEALLETLDALSSARAAQDSRATSACIALLSKLYTGAGFPDAARTLRETAEGARPAGA